MKRLVELLIVAAALCLVGPALADTYTWNGTTGSWADSARWGGTPYANSSDVGNVNSGEVQVNATTFQGQLNINTDGTLFGTLSMNNVAGTGDNIHLNGGRIVKWGSSSVGAIGGAISVDAYSYLDSGGSGTSGGTISATLTGSAGLERRSGVAAINFSGDNSGYHGNWIVSGSDAYLGFNSNTAAGSGTITVNGGYLTVGNNVTLANQITLNTGGNFRLGDAGKTHTLSDLRLNGGRIYRSNSSSATLNGAVSVLGNSLVYGESGPLNLAAMVSGSADLDVSANVTGLYIGSVNVQADNSGYQGDWTVSQGLVQFTNNNALGSGDLKTVATGVARLAIKQDWTLTNNIGGGGKIEVGASGSSNFRHNTLTVAGGTVSPGSSAGVLTISNPSYSNGYRGNLAFALNGATAATLAVDVTGGDAVAGADYDQLVVEGYLSDLDNADLVVTVDPSLTLADLAGDTLTIVTCLNDLTTAPHFGHVTFSGTWLADVTYGNGTITLSNWTPEPATLGLLATGFLPLVLRRRRR